MQGFHRRKFLKVLGVSAATMGLASVIGNKKSNAADEMDWFQNINRVKDPPISLSPKEKGHAPSVRMPDAIKSGEPFQLDIQIGETLHPMTAGHYIQWIEVYLGTDLVTRVEFSPLCPQARVAVPVAAKESATLRILSRCNLHGIWETTRRVVL